MNSSNALPRITYDKQPGSWQGRYELRNLLPRSAGGVFERHHNFAYTSQMGSHRPKRREFALSRLEKLWRMRKVDWDGMRPPVRVESYEGAKRFLKALPANIGVPAFDSSAKGWIVVQWRNVRDLATVLIRDDGTFVYSAIVGEHGPRGTESLDKGIPGDLISAIRRIT